MKLSIFYLIKGESDKYVQKLVTEVGPKFGENYLVENHLPSHITLKSPFETENIKEVEKVMECFANQQNSSEIYVNGFDNFREFVAFLKPVFSEKALKMQKQLIRELGNIGVDSREHDEEFKPHVTLSYGNTKDSFDKIWNYLKTLKKPEFSMNLDNIAIMKKGKKSWKIHKEFKLK